MSKLITLHGKYGEGKFAIVDDEDYEYLNSYRWNYSKRGYVITSISNIKYNMHKLILGTDYCKNKLVCDHINHNTLDNRRSNLRIVTIQQNNSNSRIHKENKIGFKGVRINNRGKHPIAYIRYKKINIYLGSYLSAEDAAIAYDNKARELFGEFACLNFPEIKSYEPIRIKRFGKYNNELAQNTEHPEVNDE